VYNFDSKNQIFVLEHQSGMEITFNEIQNSSKLSLTVSDEEKQRVILYFYKSNEFCCYSVRETGEAAFPAEFVNMSKIRLDSHPFINPGFRFHVNCDSVCLIPVLE